MSALEAQGLIVIESVKGRSEAHEEELHQAHGEFEALKERLQGYVHELTALGVELKDYLTGLIDFPARFDGRDVYLCWRLGEPEVAHWHEVDAGFAGRQKLTKVVNR